MTAPTGRVTIIETGRVTIIEVVTVHAAVVEHACPDRFLYTYGERVGWRPFRGDSISFPDGSLMSWGGRPGQSSFPSPP